MLHAASLSFNQIFSKPFRGVLYKSLALTLALLVAVFFGMQALLAYFLAIPEWMQPIIAWVSGFFYLASALSLMFLIIPVSTIFAGIYLDDIAEVVEGKYYPMDQPGRSLDFFAALFGTVKFTLLVIFVNIIALSLVLFAGLGIVVFFIANGYLLGREYFEFAASRHRLARDAKKLRRNNSLTVFMAGLVIAGFMAIPILNILTPLFATAFMVHVHKMVVGSAMPEEV